jgi:hypothetical protein
MLAVFLGLLAFAPVDGRHTVAPGVAVRVVEVVDASRCWVSCYSRVERDCAEAGGMRLRAHMNEAGGAWVGCAVYADRLVLLPGDAFVLRWGETQERSLECATAEGPAERRVMTTASGPVTLSDATTARARSGGFVLMLRFRAGAVRVERGRIVQPDSVTLERG